MVLAFWAVIYATDPTYEGEPETTIDETSIYKLVVSIGWWSKSLHTVDASDFSANYLGWC